MNRERGSAMMLMPAAVLIVVVLASLAVDFSLAFLGERELLSLANAAANDAATAAFERDDLFGDGAFRLNQERAQQIAEVTINASSTEVDLERPVVELLVVDGRPAVRVTLRGTIDYVFAQAIPGASHEATVEATSVAFAAEVP